MGSSSQSIDDVCTAVSRTPLPTPPTRSANACAARAPGPTFVVTSIISCDQRPPQTRANCEWTCLRRGRPAFQRREPAI